MCLCINVGYALMSLGNLFLIRRSNDKIVTKRRV